MIQVIHSAATTLSDMLNPYKVRGMPPTGMSGCDREPTQSLWFDVVSVHAVPIRKARMGCLKFTARLQLPHRKKAGS
jgi:hypothetical protein